MEGLVMNTYTDETIYVGNSEIWRTNERTFEMWICSVAYALGFCNDVLLRLCRDIALVQSEVEELPLPQAIVNLARRRDLDVGPCKLISLQDVVRVSHTTIFAIKCREYIILGAESRSTDHRNVKVLEDDYKKIRGLHDNIYILISGSADIAFQIVKNVRKRLKRLRNNQTVEAAANYVRDEVTSIFPRGMAAGYIVGGGYFPSNLAIGDACAEFDINHIFKKEDEELCQLVREDQAAFDGTGKEHVQYFAGNVRRVMSEKEAFGLVFGGLRCACRFDLASGGILRAVGVKRHRRPNDKMRSWKPVGDKTPSCCYLPYRPLREDFIMTGPKVKTSS